MYNYIEQSKEIAFRLTECGFAAQADDLLEAIESGSSGNEIAMAVRFTLQKYADGGVPLPNDIRNDMVIVITMINQLLR